MSCLLLGPRPCPNDLSSSDRDVRPCYVQGSLFGSANHRQVARSALQQSQRHSRGEWVYYVAQVCDRRGCFSLLQSPSFFQLFIYDATHLYFLALNETIQAGGDIRDGVALMQTVRKIKYQGEAF